MILFFKQSLNTQVKWKLRQAIRKLKFFTRKSSLCAAQIQLLVFSFHLVTFCQESGWPPCLYWSNIIYFHSCGEEGSCPQNRDLWGWIWGNRTNSLSLKDQAVVAEQGMYTGLITQEIVKTRKNSHLAKIKVLAELSNCVPFWRL